MRRAVLGMIAGLGFAGAAHASERTAYAAIASGDLAAAERTLVAERRIFPDRPELMLNLAAVYARTGRVEEARTLYQAVRARPASALRLSGGTSVNSHDIAARGLEKLDSAAPIVAAR